jgi:hypothetical protein
MCCATQPCIGGTGADACCPGTAGNTYCQGLIDSGSAVCGAGNVCTACAAVTGNTYIVDPVNGSDATGTGSASPVESCALKTIKRALTLIGTPTAATTIQVVGGATGPSTASGETFPIVVPTNVTITTKPASGAVTVTIPAGVAGFTMNSPASAIQGNTGASLTITTTANGATDGVVVGGTAGTGGATTLANVSITGMLSSGILVNAGVVTINAGVVSNDNGTATSAGHGLDVEAGEAIVTGGATAATTFNGNSAHGILVEGTGLINLTGAVTTANPGVGTVETNGNVLAGVWMQQTPGAVTLTSSTITGLVSFGNTGGNGMHIVVGSRVTVRGSVFLGNKVNGVNISGGNGVGTVDSMAGIDLGNTTTNGANTFQAPMNQGNNEAAGICIDVANGQAALLAVGNQFQATNCATTAATLYLNATTCTNSVAACATGVCDLGLTNPVAGPVASNNSFNVSKCTQ